MKIATQAKVNNPYKECMDPRLEGFKDKKYIKEICKRYYGNDVLL